MCKNWEQEKKTINYVHSLEMFLSALISNFPIKLILNFLVFNAEQMLLIHVGMLINF